MLNLLAHFRRRRYPKGEILYISTFGEMFELQNDKKKVSVEKGVHHPLVFHFEQTGQDFPTQVLFFNFAKKHFPPFC